MAKYIVNCKDNSVQLGCKFGQFTFNKGDIIERDELALMFPNLFVKIVEKPVQQPVVIEPVQMVTSVFVEPIPETVVEPKVIVENVPTPVVEPVVVATKSYNKPGRKGKK